VRGAEAPVHNLGLAQVGRKPRSTRTGRRSVGLLLVVVYILFYKRPSACVRLESCHRRAHVLVVVSSRLQQIHALVVAGGISGHDRCLCSTADSFVVYFERFGRGREGQKLRRRSRPGGSDARANHPGLRHRVVQCSDAAVLFAIGRRQGFEYTSCMTTLIDVLSGCYVQPSRWWTLLAGTKFFGKGHPMSGLDPARARRQDDRAVIGPQ